MSITKIRKRDIKRPRKGAARKSKKAASLAKLGPKDLLKVAKLLNSSFKEIGGAFEELTGEEKSIVGDKASMGRLTGWVSKYLIKHDPVAAFDALDPAAKRVIIAKDVLAQLRLGNMKAVARMYFSHIPSKDLDLDSDEEVGEVLAQNPKCQVCALGSLFVAAVKRADKLKVGSTGHDSTTNINVHSETLFSYLEDFFTEEQLSLIESAFEGSAYGDEYLRSIKFGSVVLGRAYKPTNPRDSKAVMTAIMRNIVRNKGEFVPPKGAEGTDGDDVNS